MPAAPDFLLRPAVAAEAPALSALARAAKASWGYPTAWLDAWAEDLVVTATQAGSGDYVVAEHAGRILGFSGLTRTADGWRLEHLWVAPEAQCRGVGRALVQRARKTVRERGGARLEVISDPHAEEFYLACGATRSGTEATSVLGTERLLPRLVFAPA